MPISPPTPCRQPGCSATVSPPGYCTLHKRKAKPVDKRTTNSYDRGYDNTWRKIRAQHLMANPLCVICAAKGYVKMANVVDHIIPHKGDKALFYDFDNLQSLCTRCHNRKTAREDGGFGNKQR